MRLFQITQDDLAELERILPQLALELMGTVSVRQRMQFRRCKQILSDVRWNYGPPTHVEVVGDDTE